MFISHLPLLLGLAILGSFICETFEFPNIYDLSQNWELSLQGSETLRFGNITIPTSVHSVLRNNGVIDDPCFGFNDFNYRWIALSDWSFRSEFDLTEDPSENIYFLVFDGIDTIADIYFNGEFIGHTDNMFRSWNFQVEPKPGSNQIEVLLSSAVSYAEEEASRYPYQVPQVCPPDSYRGFCQANFIRKEPSSFSWDWGPGFAPQGIWKPVRLTSASKQTPIVGVSSVNVYKKSESESSEWTVQLFMHVEGNSNSSSVRMSAPRQALTVQIFFSIPELDYFQTLYANLPVRGSSFGAQMSLSERSLDIQHWYPNGYGQQKLYSCNVTVWSPYIVSSSFLTKIGFREVRLVQNEVHDSTGSKVGLTFYFEVNGVPVFAKGSNWIPADAFQENVTESRLRLLLESAKEANMNMLRVWGGGIYESDLFYDIADELGIMIWQDMMFACSMYPVDQPFLLNVQNEVHQQVTRLLRHPSIVIWAGNNENEIALAQNWYSIPLSNISQYKQDYVTLYVDTIQNTIQNLDTSRPFVTSSPSNGLESISENYLSKKPWSEFYGDVHVYDYVTDCFDTHHYPVPRFASEYGFQSWPSYWSIASVTSEEERKLNSDWFNERNHHPKGNEQIRANLRRHFGYEISTNRSEDLKRFVYLTQLENALCIQIETEHYMRHQGHLDGQGRGLTMGAMYWQLNDIWPAPTWASIDYSGKWKMPHNYAQHFFQPVHVFGQTDDLYTTNTTLHIVATSSVANEGTADLKVTLWMLSSYIELTEQVFSNVNIRPRNSTELVQIDLNDLVTPFKSCSSRSEFCYIQLTLLNLDSQSRKTDLGNVVDRASKQEHPPLSTNFVFFKAFNDARSFLCADVTIASYRLDSDLNYVIVEFSFSRSSQTALFFWIDFPQKFQGYWKDNGITIRGMPPEFSQTVSRVFVIRDKSVTQENLDEFVSSLQFFYLNQKPNCYEYVF